MINRLATLPCFGPPTDNRAREPRSPTVLPGGQLRCPACLGILNRHTPARCPECLQAIDRTLDPVAASER